MGIFSLNKKLPNQNILFYVIDISISYNYLEFYNLAGLGIYKKYAGAEDGKYNDDFRASVKTFQGENGLRKSGSLNRATLEKMGIALTDTQKEIPVNPNDLSSGDGKTTATKRGPVFRANKDQVTEVQTKLKTGGMYAGEATGKLDDPTREAIRKWQTVNGVKVTGTLNKETLEKMGIELTEKQKAM